MKLRSILAILALIAFLSTVAGGYLYFSSLANSIMREADRQAAAQVSATRNLLAATMAENLRVVQTLAGLNECSWALAEPRAENLAAVNELLEHFSSSMRFDVCYLMDSSGNTVAATNRDRPDSFVGHNYAFRPYFVQAMRGLPTIYMAVGATTGIPGFFYSYPVYGPGGQGPLGVAVGKVAVDAADKLLRNTPHGQLLLVDSHGLVFLGPVRHWQYKILWAEADPNLEDLRRSRQFGEGPWENIGFQRQGANRALGPDGRQYLCYDLPVVNAPGWSVIYLRDYSGIFNGPAQPAVRRAGLTFVLFTVLIVGLVALLYRSASQDLKRRQRAETALAESEGRFRSIVEHSHDGIIIIDGNFCFTYVNQEFCRILAHTEEELLGRDFRLFLDEDSRALVQENYLRRRRGEPTPPRYEFNVVRRDGEKRRVETNSVVFTTPSGQQQTVAQLLDITERKQAEEALRVSEEKYRTILENMEEGYFELDLAGNFTFGNEAVVRFLGYSRTELYDLSWKKVMLQERWLGIVGQFQEVFKTGRPGIITDYPVKTWSGEIRTVETSISLMRDKTGQPMGYRGLSRDVTERVKAREALQASEEKYRTILESIGEGYFEVDLAGSLTFFNDTFCKIIGYDRDELPGMNYQRLCTPDGAAVILQRTSEVYRTGLPSRVMDYSIVTKSGETRILQGSAALLKDQSGGPVGFRGLAWDVTEVRQAEDALRESQERYRIVLDSNPDPMVIYDRDLQVVYFNPVFSEVFGWSLEECSGRPMEGFVPADAWAETEAMIRMVAEGERFTGLETRRTAKDGTVIPVSVSGASYRDKQGRIQGIVVNLRDVRQRKNLELQLQQAQKMEAVGTLASGIAHDFNNLLQVISGYVQLVMNKGGLKASHLKYLKETDLTVARASEVVQRLLTFSRKVATELKAVNLGREIRHTVRLLERTIPKMIRIETRLDQELSPVSGDASQIQQIVINLATNAKDAMPEGGALTIETANVTLDEDYCRTHLEARLGDHVRLRVSDTGVGMDPKTIEHIFEPFFTTKAVGEGTGLGLSTVYGIVKSHGGHIDCTSSPGLGTTFDIFFPALASEEAVPPGGEAALEEVHGGSETILLVDDEESIREIARDTLEVHGYSILEADSGEHALEIIHGAGGVIDLVVLDLGMPGMGGTNCLKELRRLAPDLKVVIATGYSTTGRVQDALSLGAQGLLNKPYRLVELLKTVRQVIDGV
jgi:PAS domain S-box-containing protein